MRSLLCFIIFLLPGIYSPLAAQVTLRGQIRDSLTHEPLPFAAYVIKGTVKGGLTDQFGRYTIKTEKLPVTLVFTLLSYRTLEKKINDSLPRLISLSPAARQLEEVVISAKNIEILREKDQYSYFDFTFYDEFILALAARPNGKCELQLLGDNGRVIRKLPVPRNAEALYNDCLGAVQLLCPDSSYQVFYDYNELRLIYASPIDSFNNVLRPCKCRVEDYYYFGWPSYRQLKMNYFYVDWYRKGKLEPMYTAGDSARISSFQTNYDLAYFLSKRHVKPFPDPRYCVPVDFLKEHLDSFRLTEPLLPEDQRWLTPIDAPLYAVGREVVVVNFPDARLLRFSKNGKLEGEYNFPPAATRHLKKELLVDEVNARLYAWEEKKGHSYLLEIDITNGKVVHTYDVADRTFISHPRIRDGELYFLWKDIGSDLPRKINRMRLR